MKNYIFILYLLCLAAEPLRAQLVLEHEYPFAFAGRLLVPGAGERYFAHDVAGWGAMPEIHWFDADHNAVQTVTLAVDSPHYWLSDFAYNSVASDFFDNDPGIEIIACIVVEATPNAFTRYQVFDDNGEALSGLFEYRPRPVTQTDGTRRLIIGRKVYSVPDLAEVYDFSDGYGQYFFGDYAVLDDGTGLYWYVGSDGEIKHRNNDFSLHSVLAPAGSSLAGCALFDFGWYGRQTLNQDSAFEWFVTRLCGDSVELRFYSGNELTLSLFDTVPSNLPEVWAPMPQAGVDHPVLTHYDLGTDITNFYDPLTGMLELSLPGGYIGQVDDSAGVLFYPEYF